MDKIIVDCTSGSVQVVPLTPDELAAIPSAAPTPIDLLNKLDADNQLTQRNLRETIMLMNEAFKTISGGALDLGQIPGVAQVYAVEAEAAALRAQL
jgi:hypothetical protein